MIIVTRLIKKANNTSRRMHQEVELMTINGCNNRSLLQQADMHFVIARRIIADLPIPPTNDLMYKLVDDMMAGKYADLGPIDKADNNWSRWLERTKDILQKDGRWAIYNSKNTLNTYPIISIRR